jgi:hypothetical protein
MLNWLIASCRAALIGLAVGLVGACASDAGSASASGPRPAIIAIRNVTGRQLASMSIEEDKDPSKAPLRMGAMSPVMPDHTYTFARPPSARALPAKLRVTYRMPGGRPQTRVVDVREATRGASGDPNQAAVFEVRPDGDVVVYLDQVKP